MLSVVAENKGDAGDTFYLIGSHLCEASHDDNLSVGVLAVGLADGVAAFFLGHRGDGASVDEVKVGFLVEVDYGVTLVGEASQQVGGLGVVELASEGMGGDDQSN